MLGRLPPHLTFHAPAPRREVTIATPTQRLRFPDANVLDTGGPLSATVLIPSGSPVLSEQSAAPTQYFIVTDGTPATLERLRTAAAQADPTLTVMPPAAYDLDAGYNVPIYRALIFDGSIVMLLLAFAAITVAAIDRASERKTNVAMQTAIGVPLSITRRSQLVQVLLPYGAGITLATVLGVISSRAYQRAGGFDLVIPVGGVALTAALAILGAGLVALSCLPALGAGIRSDLLHHE